MTPSLKAQMSSEATRRYPGVIVTDDTGALAVNVRGSILPATFNQAVVLGEGDPVMVSISTTSRGQSVAYVDGRSSSVPSPGQGTVAAVMADGMTARVNTGAGPVDALFLASYAPSAGDTVVLQWGGAQPTILGKLRGPGAPVPPAPPPPPPAPAPPPAKKQTGTTRFRAVDSATWTPALGTWDRWAGQRGRVHQGTWSGNTLTGAFFYGNQIAAAMRGKTITRVRFRFPQRLRVGAYAPAQAHLFRHTSRARPAGDVTRTGPQADYTRADGQGPSWEPVPAGFFAGLASGHGLALFGDPYMGFLGVPEDPEAGQLEITWTTT